MTTPNVTAEATTPSADISRAADTMATSIADVAAGGWRDGDSTYGLSADTRELLTRAGQEITTAVAELRAADETARATLADKTLYPEGATELAKQARAQGAQDANEQLSQADITVALAEAALVVESAPSLGESFTQRSANTHEAERRIRMVLDTAEGTELPQRIQMLAESDGHVGALMTDSEFLNLYLIGHGVNDASRRDAMVEVARQTAISARAGRGNQAAILARKVGKLRGAAGAARSLSQHKW